MMRVVCYRREGFEELLASGSDIFYEWIRHRIHSEAGMPVLFLSFRIYGPTAANQLLVYEEEVKIRGNTGMDLYRCLGVEEEAAISKFEKMVEEIRKQKNCRAYFGRLEAVDSAPVSTKRSEEIIVG